MSQVSKSSWNRLKKHLRKTGKERKKPRNVKSPSASNTSSNSESGNPPPQGLAKLNWTQLIMRLRQLHLSWHRLSPTLRRQVIREIGVLLQTRKSVSRRRRLESYSLAIQKRT